MKNLTQVPSTLMAGVLRIAYGALIVLWLPLMLYTVAIWNNSGTVIYKEGWDQILSEIIQNYYQSKGITWLHFGFAQDSWIHMESIAIRKSLKWGLLTLDQRISCRGRMVVLSNWCIIHLITDIFCLFDIIMVLLLHITGHTSFCNLSTRASLSFFS